MKRRIGTLMLGSVMLSLTVVAAGTTENALPVAPVSPWFSNLDCEGDACAQVTLTFDEAKQQYKVQNNSADRTVRVEASNWSGGSSVRVEAGKTDYLLLKSFAGPYRANYE